MKKILLSLLILSSIQGIGQVISLGNGSTFSSQYVYYYPNGWWSGIYQQAEIGQAGDIYSISVVPDIISDNSYYYNNQAIYVGHLSETEFLSKDVPNTASMTLVFSGGLRFYDLQELTIEFNQPFTYNNSDNLIVYWENRDGDYQRSVRFPATEAGNMYLASYAHTFQDTALAIASNRADIKLNFARQQDIRPVELILPYTDGDLSDAEQIRLYVENLAYEDVTSFDMKYSLDQGETWISQSFSGTIQSFTRAIFSFSVPADMSAEGDYEIMVVTTLAGDEIPDNDTLIASVTHLVKGAKCSDPILLTDPVIDLEGNTFETGNHYHYDGNVYCASNYVGENDAIYAFTLTEDTDISLRVDADRNVRVGLHLLDGCPESSPNCLQWAGGTLPTGILGKKLGPGTYYVVVSSFPSISDYYYFLMDWDWTQDTDFKSFDVGSVVSSNIDKVNHSIDIIVPNGTDISTMSPAFSVPDGSTVSIAGAIQTSGVSVVDFTNPVTYTVKSSADIYAQDWTITISEDTNTPPTDISLDNNLVYENQATGVVIGTMSPVDSSPGTYTYSLIAGAGDNDNASFIIENNVLKSNAVFDYESKNAFEIRVQCVENGIYSVQKAFLINVIDLNENPLGLYLSNSSIPELAGVGSVVGTFTTDDQEGGDFTYSLVTGAGDSHNTFFYVENDSLKTGTQLDAETLNTLYIRAETSDSEGLSYSTSFTIEVIEQDEAPVDITLSKNSIDENNPLNALVGSFASDDPEGGSFIYNLVSGDGDDDNTSFSLSGNMLLANEVFNAEIKQEYFIRVETEDESGLTYAESFTISIVNKNEAPDSIYLSSYAVEENAALYTEIGELFAHDPEDTSGFLFGLSTGEGSEDNDKFLISVGKLVTKTVLDYESGDSLSIRLRVYDPGFLAYYQVIKIAVDNVNENPTAITLSNISADENLPVGTGILKLTGTDPEGAPMSFSLVTGYGDTDNASFAIDGDSLRSSAVFDYETKSYYQVRIRVSDSEGLSFENYYTITINDVFENSAPYGIDLNYGWIYENVPIGTGVGRLVTYDQTYSSYNYELVSGEGDAHNYLFFIEGDSVRTNAMFDYETQSEYSIRIRSSEEGAEGFERSFNVMIFNAYETPSAIKITNDSIPRDSEMYQMIGQLFAEGEDLYYNFSYSLTNGDGDQDNDKFFVNSDILYLNTSLTGIDQASFSIRIRAFDYEGHSVEQILTIHIIDTNGGNTSMELSKINTAILYPNPASDILKLELSNSFRGSFDLYVFDMLGKQIMNSRIQKPTEKLETVINIHSLPPGLYTVIVHHGTMSDRMEFIKR